MHFSLTEHLPGVVALFPNLKEIPLADWDKSGIRISDIGPGYIFDGGRFLEYGALILKGTLRMYKVSTGGREITLYRIHEGECCPLMASSILGETEYEASVCIETRAKLLLIPVTIFRDWVDHHQSFRHFIFHSFAHRIMLMSRLLDTINFKSIRQRVAEYLVQMTADGDDILQLTHSHLSVELGTAREVISRTLKAFENEGTLKLTRGRIQLLNRQALLLELCV